MNKQQILEKLENLVVTCHKSINRMQLSKEGIPAIEVGLLENKLITLYDEVQRIKALQANDNEKNEAEIFDDHSANAPTAAIDDEIEQLIDKAEEIRTEVKKEKEKEESKEVKKEEKAIISVKPPRPSEKLTKTEKETSHTAEPVPTEKKKVADESLTKSPSENTPKVQKEEKQEVKNTAKQEPVSQAKSNKIDKGEEKPKIIPKPAVSEKGKSLNDSISRGEKLSLHEKLAARQEKQKEVSARFSGRPIADIKKAIGLNQQVLFTKELFNNDKRAFRKAIDFVNRCKNFSEAKSYLQFEVMPKQEWEEDNELYKDLLAIIKRKFA